MSAAEPQTRTRSLINRMVTLLLGAFLLCLALALWRTPESLRGAPLARVEPSVANGDRSAESSADMTRISDVVTQLSSRLDKLEHTPAAAPAPQQAPERVATTPEERLASQQRAAKRTFAAFEAELSAERIDRDWDRQFRDVVKGAFSTIPGVDVVQIRCGSTLCRTDIRLPSDVQPQELLQKLSQQAVHGGIMFTTDESTAKAGTAVFYEARPESELPFPRAPG